MKRIAKLLPLLLVLALTLTGCNLIAVDEVAVIKRDMETMRKTYTEAVMAEYDGGTVTMEDVTPGFFYNYNYMAQMYSQFGMTYNMDAASELEMVQSTTENVVRNIAIEKQFDARGLTAEKTAEEIEAEALETWNEDLENAKGYVEGKTEEVKLANAEALLYANGMTEELVKASTRQYYAANAVEEAVKNEISELTDEELQAAYETRVAADEEAYTESPTSIESDATDADKIIAWNPEGYRTVKHILLKAEGEEMDAVNNARAALKTAQEELASLEAELIEVGGEVPQTVEEPVAEVTEEAVEETTEEPVAEEAAEEPAVEETAEEETEEPAVEEQKTAKFGVAYAEEAEETEEVEPRSVEEVLADYEAKKAEVETLEADVAAAEAALVASMQDKLNEVYAKLDAGEDFDAVMAEYGEDDGMKNEPVMSTGYYVAENSTQWDPNFTAAAMALNAVGEYTPIDQVAISSYGIHILYYNSDVTPGAVPLESIHDALYKVALEEAQEDHFEAEVESWIEAMNVTYHFDNWKSVLG